MKISEERMKEMIRQTHNRPQCALVKLHNARKYIRYNEERGSVVYHRSLDIIEKAYGEVGQQMIDLAGLSPMTMFMSVLDEFHFRQLSKVMNATDKLVRDLS